MKSNSLGDLNLETKKKVKVIEVEQIDVNKTNIDETELDFNSKYESSELYYQNMVKFWGICIPIRLSIGIFVLWLGYNYNYISRFLAIYTAITTLGHLERVIRDPKFGMSGGPMWWSRVRYIHVLLWFTTTILLALGFEWAGYFLIGDAILGIISGILHYNFKFVL